MLLDWLIRGLSIDHRAKSRFKANRDALISLLVPVSCRRNQTEVLFTLILCDLDNISLASLMVSLL